MDLVQLLEEFRKQEHHYPDVVWHDIRAKKLKTLVAEKLADMTREEFRSLLLSNMFMRLRLEEQSVDDIITQNDFNEIKLRIFDLFFGKRPIKDRMQSLMDLKGVGPYTASQLLAAVGEDEYVVYHQNVIKGIEDLIPHIIEWALIDLDITTVDQYLNFNEVCRSIKKIYGFKTLGEVHEFFWHGHHSKWKFDRR